MIKRKKKNTKKDITPHILLRREMFLSLILFLLIRYIYIYIYWYIYIFIYLFIFIRLRVLRVPGLLRSLPTSNAKMRVLMKKPKCSAVSATNDTNCGRDWINERYSWICERYVCTVGSCVCCVCVLSVLLCVSSSKRVSIFCLFLLISNSNSCVLISHSCMSESTQRRILRIRFFLCTSASISGERGVFLFLIKRLAAVLVVSTYSSEIAFFIALTCSDATRNRSLTVTSYSFSSAAFSLRFSSSSEVVLSVNEGAEEGISGWESECSKWTVKDVFVGARKTEKIKMCRK